jgi:hypothetical protein
VRHHVGELGVTVGEVFSHGIESRPTT